MGQSPDFDKQGKTEILKIFQERKRPWQQQQLRFLRLKKRDYRKTKLMMGLIPSLSHNMSRSSMYKKDKIW